MASITKRGEEQFRALVRRKGYVLSKTFYFKKDAEIWARKTESEIDRGLFVNTQEAERLTLFELINRYEIEVLPNLKAHAQEKSRLKVISKNIGYLSIASITSSVIIKYRNLRLTSIAENSVNREVTSLKRLLSFAHEDCKITLPNGIPHVKKLTIDDSRDRRVTDDEIKAICINTDSKELAYIIELALHTAMRRSELSNLKRNNINFTIPCVKLYETKNGKNRTVPLTPIARDLLKSIPANINGNIFRMSNTSITKAFERARRRARGLYEAKCKAENRPCDDRFLIDLRFHDLRHEATSRLATLLPNVIELSRVTGHKELKMLNRYYQVSIEDLAIKLG